MDKRAVKFFTGQGLLQFITSRKDYEEQVQIKFFAQDYREAIEGEDGKYDLLISQWAGISFKVLQALPEGGRHSVGQQQPRRCHHGSPRC